jgi:hypothetical protein
MGKKEDRQSLPGPESVMSAEVRNIAPIRRRRRRRNPAVLMGLERNGRGGFYAYIFCPVGRNTQSTDFGALNLRSLECPNCQWRHSLVGLEEALERDLFSEGDSLMIPAETLWAWHDEHEELLKLRAKLEDQRCAPPRLRAVVPGPPRPVA